MKYKYFLLWIMLVHIIGINAAEKRTIHVATSGNLSNYISEEEKYEIKELTLTGELNGSDFRLLRDMCGNNYKGVMTNGKLKKLDLTEATIVEGGEDYLSTSSISASISRILIGKGTQKSTSENTLSEYLFAGCHVIESISIPNSVKSIGRCSFQCCNNLTSITISNSVTSIDNSAFSRCSSLASITVESGNSKYDSRNYSNAIIETSSNSLIFGCKNTVIPNSVTSIGDDAFYQCSDLTSITIPNSVTTIGDYSFYQCSGLTSITIPNSVTTIGDYAFYQCSGLTSITIPNRVTNIGVYAFSGCCGLASITVSDGNTKYDSRNNSNAIIETSSNSLTLGCKNTVIPNSVTSIEDKAFYGCSGLTSITIPNSITSIGDYAFYQCSGLTSITIPNSVTTIGDYSFYQCSGLTSITIPNSLTSIGDYAFWGCSGLKDVISEKQSLFEISEYVFSSDTYIKALLTVPKETKTAYLSTNNWNKFRYIVEKGIGYNKKNIHVEVAGTLPDLIFESEKYSIEELTLTGELNGTDFRLLRDMSGCNYLGEETEGRLKILDLSGTKVIAGGEKYVDTNRILGRSGEFHYAIIQSNELPQHVFHGCNSLGSVILSNGIESIGDGAFYTCSGLTSITIPKGVTDIGNSAFQDCTSLTSLIIPNSVISIGDNAFYNCLCLTSITIPNSVISIGYYAFGSCKGLTSVTIPNSVTSIGIHAFSSCNSLTSIMVGSGNSKFDSRNNCYAIIETLSNSLIIGCKNTIIPSSVTSIGKYAFSGCSGLTTITIPNSVTSIGNGAFSYCSGLISITLPNSVTSIGNSAFYECSSLLSITIPNSVINIGNGAFSYCPKLTDLFLEIQNPFEISEGVFSPITYTYATLTIPKGTKSAYQSTNCWNKFNSIIEGSAENDSDKPIQFADAEVKRICVMYWDTNGDGELSYKEAADVTSFGHSWYLKNINSFDEAQFFTGVTSIGNDAFGSCSSLTSITIPNSVTTIGEYAFSNCSSLSSITIPNSVTSIGDWSFYNCTSLTSVILSNSMTKIPDYAFWGCSALTSVIIPNSVTSIGNNVFENCVALTSFTIPNSITSIGHEAFRDCSSLTSIEIPNSVINIESSAFAGCSSLVSIIVDSDNFVYDSRENCNAIIRTADNKLLLGCKKTVIPNSVNSIGSWAFSGCSGLTSITIPNSVTSIGNRAFQNCSGLTSITIPNSVTSIGDFAFYGCSELTDIFSAIQIPFEIPEYTFSPNTYAKSTLTVPIGTKSAYLSTKYWNQFSNIVEKEPEIIMGDTNGDGNINVADIVEVVNCIMGRPSEKFLEEAADLTGDGIVNVADIVKLVSLVMGQSSSRQDMAMAETKMNNDQLALTENTDHTLSLLLTNDGNYTASQFDIKLAEGQTLERVELNRQRAAHHQLVYTQTGSNTYRVMVYSMSNSCYEGNEGELLKIHISGGQVGVDNILFMTNKPQEIHFAPLYSGISTAVEATGYSPFTIEQYYDLQGRRITNGQRKKGVYIRKGKKHITR